MSEHALCIVVTNIIMGVRVHSFRTVTESFTENRDRGQLAEATRER
jgi:hypothetical protein